MSDENSNPPPVTVTADPNPNPNPKPVSEVKEESPVTKPVVTEKKVPVPKYQRREVQMLEREGCGGCNYAEDVIVNQIKPNSDVETILKKVAYDSPEGKSMIKQHDIKYSPFIQECLIPSDPNEKPICKEYKTIQDYKYKLKVND